MTLATLVRLADVCEQDRRVVKPGDAANLPYIGLESIEANTGRFHDGELSKTPDAPQANSFRFDTHHVLYGKLRPYLNKVAVPDFEGKCSTEIIPLRPRDNLDRRYLAYYLRSPATVSQISARTAGARMPRADMDFVLGMQVPLPPIPEQRRIVDILSRAEGILRLRREAEKKAAELVPAIFLEMFGDPVTNPRGLPIVSLSQVADVQGGLQVTRKRATLPLERPYLRVANVYRSRLNLSELKTIRITEAELKRTRLEAGDLLIVEGHGNPNEVGRVAVWDGSLGDCSHQNHLIRARPNREALLPEYASALLNSAGGRKALRIAAKTTSGLSTISTKNVKNVPIMLPPIENQRSFVTRIVSVQSIARLQEDASKAAAASLEALLARDFSQY